MKRFVFMSALTAAAALLLWGAVLFRTAKEAGRVGDQYAARVDRVAVNSREVLMRLAAMPSVIELNADAVSDPFAAEAEANPHYLTVALSDRGGSILFSTYRQKPGSTLRDRKYFNDTLAKRDFAAGEFTLGKMTGRGVFHFSYPVIAGDGDLRGTVNVSIDLLGMGKMLGFQDLPAGAGLDLVDHRGVILCTSRDPVQRTGKSITKGDFDWLRGLNGKETKFAVGDGGSRWAAAGRQLRLPDGSVYAYLKIDVPAEKAEGRAFGAFSWILVLAGAGFLAVMMRRGGKSGAAGQGGI